jgi:hypothetical protein
VGVQNELDWTGRGCLGMVQQMLTTHFLCWVCSIDEHTFHSGSLSRVVI